MDVDFVLSSRQKKLDEMFLFSTLNSPFLECPMFTFAFPQFNIYLLSFFPFSQ